MAQVFAEYPGVGQVVSCAYTRTLGTLPNVAVMRIIPQPQLPSPNGTLTIGHGAETVSFPNCRIDSASISITSTGHIETLRILDRRWKWQFGAADGIYNIRQADGTIRTSTRKSARELAGFLFQALGEFQYEVSALPADDYPTVEWDCESARVALEQLCEQYGCDVDLDWTTNIPRVVTLGLGLDLPNDPDVMNIAIGADFAEVPDAIEVCGDFTLVQSKLKLEAVGIDTDGSVKPIDDLSYTPANGWDAEGEPADLLPDASEETHYLANLSVYRMFRTTSQADGSQDVPNYSGTVSDISQLYPLKHTIIEAYETSIGVDRQAAYVTGVFSVGKEKDETGQQSLENTAITARLEDPFRLIEDYGIIVFNDPVVKHTDDVPPAYTKPDLYFVTSYHVANATRGQYERYTRSRNIASNGTPYLSVPRPSLKQTIRATYEDDGVTVATIEDNQAQVDAQAEVLLNSLHRQFVAQGASQIVYRSIKPVRMDGARRQVTWTVDRHARVPATTVANYNSELALGVLRLRERRRLLATEESRRKTEQEAERRRKLRKEGGLAV